MIVRKKNEQQNDKRIQHVQIKTRNKSDVRILSILRRK